MWERWVERVRFWPSFICAHLSPSFSSFLFLPFLCHLSRGKGRVLCGRHLGWMGTERACTEKSGWTGASWQGSLTDASWCLNPLRVCQRQQAGWLSVTVQLPLEPKAQWQSGTSLHAMAFCLPFPSLVLPLPSSILVFSFFPPSPTLTFSVLCSVFWMSKLLALPSASFLKKFFFF